MTSCRCRCSFLLFSRKAVARFFIRQMSVVGMYIPFLKVTSANNNVVVCLFVVWYGCIKANLNENMKLICLFHCYYCLWFRMYVCMYIRHALSLQDEADRAGRIVVKMGMGSVCRHLSLSLDRARVLPSPSGEYLTVSLGTFGKMLFLPLKKYACVLEKLWGNSLARTAYILLGGYLDHQPSVCLQRSLLYAVLKSACPTSEKSRAPW